MSRYSTTVNQYIYFAYIVHLQGIYIYRLDSMMTGLQDIHWVVCSLAQCMF